MVLLLALISVAASLSLHQPEPKPLALNGWQRVKSTSPRTMLRFQIALSRRFTLTKELYAVSDPLSPRYGKHWTKEQVKRATSPSRDTERVVMAWARKSHFKCSLMAGHSDWLECTAPVKRVQQALHTKFHDFAHARTPGATLPRCEQYHIPVHLAEHIDLIAGVKRLPDMRALFQPQTQKSAGNGGVTPQRSRELWKCGNTTGSKTNSNLQEVAQFLQQYMSRDDLQLFLEDVGLSNVDVNVTIRGPNDASNPGDEASLDIQTIVGSNQGTNTWFTVTGGLHDKQEPFLTWLLAISALDKAPWVHSVSYGDVEASIDDSYKTRVDQEFQKLSMQGQTFLYSAGDSGVSCNNGMQQPDFPASSPHVLSIGGVVDNGTPTPQSWSGSGGGFSNFFPDPEYMKATHQNYLNSNNNVPPSNIFNATGRGYPDVSAVAMDVTIVVGGQIGLVGGTSCASPFCSAAVSMLNDIRINAGKSTLGLINPLIYSASAAGAFVGIPSGPPNSAGNCQGFQPAADGTWSPIVGFGGFNFEKFAAVVAALP